MAEPVAWSYELATNRTHDGVYGGWEPRLTAEAPNVPEGSVRALRPLYGPRTRKSAIQIIAHFEAAHGSYVSRGAGDPDHYDWYVANYAKARERLIAHLHGDYDNG